MDDPYARYVEWTEAMGWCPKCHNRLAQPDSNFWPQCFFCHPTPVPRNER